MDQGEFTLGHLQMLNSPAENILVVLCNYLLELFIFRKMCYYYIGLLVKHNSLLFIAHYKHTGRFQMYLHENNQLWHFFLTKVSLTSKHKEVCCSLCIFTIFLRKTHLFNDDGLHSLHVKETSFDFKCVLLLRGYELPCYHIIMQE